MLLYQKAQWSQSVYRSLSPLFFIECHKDFVDLLKSFLVDPIFCWNTTFYKAHIALTLQMASCRYFVLSLHIWLANLRKDLTCCCSEDQQCNFKIRFIHYGFNPLFSEKRQSKSTYTAVRAKYNSLLSLLEQETESRVIHQASVVLRLKFRIDRATFMALCLGYIVNWIYLLTCRRHFHFLSNTLITGGSFLRHFDHLSSIYSYQYLSTSKGKLRRHKQMIFDEKQWSRAIDF